MCLEPHRKALTEINFNGRVYTAQSECQLAAGMWVWSTLQIAVAAGLATTFDDTIYLTGFFGEVNRTFRPRHVVVGELLGFSVLLAISLIGYAIGLTVPREVVGLLGVLPVAIGVRGLLELSRSRSEASGERHGLLLQQASEPPMRVAPGFPSRQLSLWQILRDRQTYSVALVSISNGSNNLSIYIPLFASLTLPKILLVIPVLYGFILIWLFLSYALTRMPGIALVLNRYARACFPFILIWLGVRILSDSGALALINAWI
jgi:cadmium resistance protein CadD (predicted permease)